jgi:hypothetical protein
LRPPSTVISRRGIIHFLVNKSIIVRIHKHMVDIGGWINMELRLKTVRSGGDMGIRLGKL